VLPRLGDPKLARPPVRAQYLPNLRLGHEGVAYAMTAYPDPALVFALVEAPAAEPAKSLDGWMVAQVSRTPRHAVVLLQRNGEGADCHCQFVFEQVGGRWRMRGGSGGSRSSMRSGPLYDDSPVVWLEVNTSSGRGPGTMSGQRPVEPPLRVVGGRARADVRHIVAETDRGVTFHVVPADSGWFHVILEGAEAVTITAVGEHGESLRDRDGLPVTLRLEALS